MSIKTLPRQASLDNGFRIIHQTLQTNTNIASIQVFCDVGSVHESEPKVRGAAHFIEHMCFKGTKKLPSSRDVNLIFDNTGSDVNAYTDRRHTCYYVSTHKDHTKKCIEVIADMLLNSKFDKHEYMKEREVVKEEAIKDEDDAELLAFTNADAVLYKGTPYAYTVDELKYHVGKNVLQYDAVLSMYKKYYTPNRMILSICSSNKFEDVCKWCKNAFTLKTNNTYQPLDLGQIEPFSKLEPIIEKRKISPIVLCIGFRTCSLHHPDKYPLKLLKAVLSGRMTSRMFMLLREENGLTYSSYASCDFFEHIGDFKLFAECNPNKFIHNGAKDGVYPLLIKMIKTLEVTEKELNDAKQYIEGNYKMKCEDPTIIAKYNGKCVLMGIKPIQYTDKYATYYAPITVEQVNACVKKYFNKDNMVVSIVGANPPSKKTVSNI
jgi:predicted Zn-dependent peptidase